MTYRAVLRGYLLEEALAWLLRNTGYRLLVHDSQDPDELVMEGNTLLVRAEAQPIRSTFSVSSRSHRRSRCRFAGSSRPSSIVTGVSCPWCATHTASSTTSTRTSSTQVARDPAPLPVRLLPVLRERLHRARAGLCSGPPDLTSRPVRRVVRVAPAQHFSITSGTPLPPHCGHASAPNSCWGFLPPRSSWCLAPRIPTGSSSTPSITRHMQCD
jgi:hypothetical protein